MMNTKPTKYPFWTIPVNWRMKGSKTSTTFSATNDQVASIGRTDGTTIVTKLVPKLLLESPERGNASYRKEG
jgi:hypothetical protein